LVLFPLPKKCAAYYPKILKAKYPFLKFGTKTNFWKNTHTNRPGVLVSGLFYHPTYFSFNYKKAANFFRIMILKKKRNDPNKEF
jgi:hypothetical protein